MARIRITEPDPDVRAMLVLMVERLGHVVAPARPDPDGDDAQVVLLEPGELPSAAAARRLRREIGDLPVVCASDFPRSPAVAALSPVDYLVKPFRLDALDAALAAAASVR